MGRLCECVEKIVDAINRENKERADERLDMMLWMMYVQRYEGRKSYAEWKKGFLGEKQEKPKIEVVEPEKMSKNLDVAAQTLSKIKRSQKGGE